MSNFTLHTDRWKRRANEEVSTNARARHSVSGEIVDRSVVSYKDHEGNRDYKRERIVARALSVSPQLRPDPPFAGLEARIYPPSAPRRTGRRPYPSFGFLANRSKKQALGRRRKLFDLDPVLPPYPFLSAKICCLKSSASIFSLPELP